LISSMIFLAMICRKLFIRLLFAVYQTRAGVGFGE
jgi:hypothetical protein